MLTDLWSDLVGLPRAEPLIEGSRRGTAGERGARPPRASAQPGNPEQREVHIPGQ